MSFSHFRPIPSALAGGILLATLSLGLQQARGDTLVFANGDKVTGTFLKQESGKIHFKSQVLGDLVVDEEEARVVKDAVKVKSKAQVQAPVYRESKGVDIAGLPAENSGAFNTTPPVAPEKVSLLKNWKNKITGGFISQSSVVDRLEMLCSIRNDWRGDKDEFRHSYEYSRSDVTDEDGVRRVTGKRIRDEVRLMHDITDKSFLQFAGLYLHDWNLGLDERLQASAGYGYRYLATPTFRGAIIPALALRRDNYLDGVTDNEDTGAEPAGMLYHEFAWQVADRMTLRNDLACSYSLEDTKQYGYECALELECAITDRMSVSFRYSLDYDCNPGADIDRFQRRFATGIGIGF